MGIPRICFFLNLAYGCICILNEIYLTTLKAVLLYKVAFIKD